MPIGPTPVLGSVQLRARHGLLSKKRLLREARCRQVSRLSHVAVPPAVGSGPPLLTDSPAILGTLTGQAPSQPAGSGPKLWRQVDLGSPSRLCNLEL